MLVTIGPLLPGMVSSVSGGSIHTNNDLQHLFAFNWLYGFSLSIVAYWALNMVSPAKSTLIPEVIHGTITVLEGVGTDMVDGERESQCRDVKAVKEARSTQFSV
jgi:NCS1 family nucleobase:cation symporter-1